MQLSFDPAILLLEFIVGNELGVCTKVMFFKHHKMLKYANSLGPQTQAIATVKWHMAFLNWEEDWWGNAHSRR